MTVRTFGTGATRDTDVGKLDYDGFLSPLALERFAEYMHEHRRQSEGTLRDSDNWQKGIPVDQYRKSMFRHFLDAWRIGRGYTATDRLTQEEITLEDALCGVLFNAFGWLHEIRKTDAVPEVEDYILPLVPKVAPPVVPSIGPYGPPYVPTINPPMYPAYLGTVTGATTVTAQPLHAPTPQKQFFDLVPALGPDEVSDPESWIVHNDGQSGISGGREESTVEALERLQRTVVDADRADTIFEPSPW